jgi:phosphoglycolate phosphatase-like HAD superfamily hydrolase
MPHESPAAILFDMDGTLMDQSFADDINNQVRYVTAACRTFVCEMTPDDCTQAETTRFDFVANTRQNER